MGSRCLKSCIFGNVCVSSLPLSRWFRWTLSAGWESLYLSVLMHSTVLLFWLPVLLLRVSCSAARALISCALLEALLCVPRILDFENDVLSCWSLYSLCWAFSGPFCLKNELNNSCSSVLET